MVAFRHSPVLPLGGRQLGARHANRRGAERSQNAPFPMAVTRAGHTLGRFVPDRPGTFVSPTPQRGFEFGFEKILYEATNACPHPIFQGIEPIIAEKMLAFPGACRRPCAIRCDRVISVGA